MNIFNTNNLKNENAKWKPYVLKEYFPKELREVRGKLWEVKGLMPLWTCPKLPFQKGCCLLTSRTTEGSDNFFNFYNFWT